MNYVNDKHISVLFTVTGPMSSFVAPFLTCNTPRRSAFPDPSGAEETSESAIWVVVFAGR